MTPLRQRMIDAMVLRGFSPRTQESYTDAIYGMAKHYRRDPAQYSAQEVEAYLLHMINERHLSYSTMNQAACAARFLYEKVLGRERELFPIAMAKVPSKQPELLAREEITRLFASCSHPVHRMLLQTMYASGLRVSEACGLWRFGKRWPMGVAAGANMSNFSRFQNVGAFDAKSIAR
ncbi:MAG: site-specific integrase [Comamonadaceae bacterium]|nr:site-specific integrase [Comamonadaceae bacterium]